MAQEAIRGQPLQPGAALTLSAPGHGSVQVDSIDKPAQTCCADYCRAAVCFLTVSAVSACWSEDVTDVARLAVRGFARASCCQGLTHLGAAGKHYSG